MDLRGFRFDNAPWQWSLQPADCKVASLAHLFRRWKEDVAYNSCPLLLKQPDKSNAYLLRDPLNADGKPYYDPCTNWVVIAYRQNFYIVIEKQYHEMFGPHPARLFYRSYQLEDEICWVAIAQLNFMWYSDEKLLIAVREAIQAEEFYQSERTGETIVIL